MSERSATPRALRYIVYLIGIGIVIVGGYYALFNMTVNNIEVKVDHFEFEYDFGYLSVYSIDVNMSIRNSGFLNIMLSERETTLYINGIHLGSKSFSESWESYPSGSRCTYSGTYLTIDSEEAQKLCEDMVYDMTLKLKAKTSSGPFYKYVEVIDAHSFDVEYYTRIIDCVLCEGEGWVDCPLCIDGDNDCFQCDGTGWDDCLFCDDGKSDCYICEDGKADCYLCTDGCSYCDYKGWNACNFCNSQGWNTCTFCNGKAGETCSGCGGDGLVDCYYCDGKAGETCSGCGGDGLVDSLLRNGRSKR